MNSDILHKLFLVWQAALENGELISPNDLCADRPELLPLMQSKIEEWESSHNATSALPTNPQKERNDRPDAADRLPTVARRYRVVEEIARGGMGVVWRVHDPEFDRPLALKVLRDSHENRAEQQDRFFEEARITAQLQHPGIPPVYEQGYLEDRRPFFAMKLIEGKTLSKLLRQRASLSDDLPRFLGVFEHICQTVAFAHSLGIIHRDLKPLNVMVGAFGEVQVMDWGLAKRIRPTESGQDKNEMPHKRTINVGPTLQGSVSPEASHAGHRDGLTPKPHGQLTVEYVSDASEHENPRSGTPVPPQIDPFGTKIGSVLGTPGYMAPEQARGEIGNLDERCDVFGLGAILCQILTGQPAFAGTDTNQVMKLANRGDLSEAYERLDASDADAELVALAKRLVAARKEDRPANASVVAQAISEYQEQVQQRLQLAQLAKAAAESRAAEEEKLRGVERQKRQAERQRNQLWLSLALMLVVCCVVGGLVWSRYQRLHLEREREQARQATEEEQRETKRKLKAEYLNAKIQNALENAELRRQKLYAQLNDPTKFHVLLSQPTRWRATLDKATTLYNEARSLARSDPKLVADAASAKLDQLKRELENDERHYNIASDLSNLRLREFLVAIRKGNRQTQRALSSRQLAAEYRTLFEREGLVVEDEDTIETIANSPIRLVWVAAVDHWAMQVTSKALGDRLMHISRTVDSDQWRNKVRDTDKWGKADELRELELEVETEKQSPQALLLFAALSEAAQLDPKPLLRKALRHHRKDILIHMALADAETDNKKKIGHYETALALDVNNLVAHSALATAWHDTKNECTLAEPHLFEALRLRPDSSTNHANLGFFLTKMIDYPRAREHFRKAIQMDPEDYDNYRGLADVELGLGRFEEAEKAATKAVELLPKDHRNRAFLKGFLKYCRERKKHAAQAQMVCGPLLQKYHKDGQLPAPKDLARLINYCLNVKMYHHTAFQLFEHQFRDDPSSATLNDRGTACMAALYTVFGLSQEGERLSPKQIDQMRKKALGWLQQNLPKYEEKIRGQEMTRKLSLRIASWFQPYLLARRLVHEPEWRNRIPVAERVAWSKLHREAKKVLWYDTAGNMAAPRGSGNRPLLAYQKYLKVGKSLWGNLLASDPVDSNKRHNRVHSVKLEANKVYTIDLVGSFDTYLRVADLKEKRMLAKNDDVAPPKNLNSRVVVSPPRTDEYRIMVSSFKPKTVGAYTLSAQELVPSGKPKEIEGKLTKDDRKVKSGRRLDIHPLTLSGGEYYTIDMKSPDFGPVVLLVDKRGKSIMIDDGKRTKDDKRSRLCFAPPRSGTYLFFVTSREKGKLGKYVLQVQRYRRADEQAAVNAAGDP